MLESIPVSLLMGSVLGFLSGLGVGGGSLLILWLTLVLKMDPVTARGINLLLFIPTALIAGIFRWKQGAVPLRKIYPAIISGCTGAFILSIVSQNLDTMLLKKIFGILLLAAGLREIFYKDKH